MLLTAKLCSAEDFPVVSYEKKYREMRKKNQDLEERFSKEFKEMSRNVSKVATENRELKEKCQGLEEEQVGQFFKISLKIRALIQKEKNAELEAASARSNKLQQNNNNLESEKAALTTQVGELSHTLEECAAVINSIKSQTYHLRVAKEILKEFRLPIKQDRKTRAIAKLDFVINQIETIASGQGLGPIELPL